MAPDIDNTTKAERPKEVQHDETPSGITDHPFEPKGLWFTLCVHCNLAESAHAETTVRRPTTGRRPQFHYVSDDAPDD